MIVRLLAALALMAGPALAEPGLRLDPASVLAQPSRYEGQTVSVGGTIDHFRQIDSQFGRIGMFRLCLNGCVIVLDVTAEPHIDHTEAGVSGVFHSQLRLPKRTIYNVVVVGDADARPGIPPS